MAADTSNGFTDFVYRHRWTVRIDDAAVERVRVLLKVDLRAEVDSRRLFTWLGDSAEFLVNLLYVVCKPEADERGLADVDFGRMVAKDPIAFFYATAALAGALGAFGGPAHTAVSNAVQTAASVAIRKTTDRMAERWK
jgi:hypothetical protein